MTSKRKRKKDPRLTMTLNEEAKEFIRQFYGEYGREAGYPYRFFMKLDEFYEFFVKMNSPIRT